jgi:uncharacterized protein (TIGR03435 family)
MIAALENHLWQSTLFAGAAGVMTLLLKNNRAQTRYYVWLAASLKFLIPFSLLVSAGGQLGWRSAPAQPQSAIPPMVETITQQLAPFATSGAASATGTTVASATGPIATLLPPMWAFGFVAVLAVWTTRWIGVWAAVRRASPLEEGKEIEMLRALQLHYGMRTRIELVSRADRLEPGVFGFRRPVLFLPAGISEHLTPSQLKAILAHELCHIRFRHTIAAAAHTLVEAIFWFHPLVWWLGARLVDERERACDEEVLRLGNEPRTYAEGILTICRLCLSSPLTSVPGVASSNLRKRIEEIMSGRMQGNLGFAKKLLMAVAGAASVAAPVLVGIVNSPRIRAQSTSPQLAFEAASMRYAAMPPGGVSATRQGGPGTNDPERLTYRSVPLKNILLNAYGLKDFQLSGPGWIGTERYDINAKIPPGATQEQFNIMMQNLVTERLRMAVHRETKDFSAYTLVVGKGGLKMKESDMSAIAPPQQQDGPPKLGRNQLDANGFPQLPAGRRDLVGYESYGHNRFTGVQISPPGLATFLENQIGRPVADATGLTGKYDFKLDFSKDGLMGAMALAGPQPRPGPNDDPNDTGPIIFSAVQDQLGLKLEEKKLPFDVLVIDRLEKMPVEN